jgi:hypothetical protein
MTTRKAQTQTTPPPNAQPGATPPTPAPIAQQYKGPDQIPPGKLAAMCPNLRCHKLLMTDQQNAGKQIQCGICGTKFNAPLKNPAMPQTQTGQPQNPQGSPNMPTASQKSKVTKTASGNTKIQVSKDDWLKIGKASDWTTKDLPESKDPSKYKNGKFAMSHYDWLKVANKAGWILRSAQAMPEATPAPSMGGGDIMDQHIMNQQQKKTQAAMQAVYQTLQQHGIGIHSGVKKALDLLSSELTGADNHFGYDSEQSNNPSPMDKHLDSEGIRGLD